MQKFIFVRKLLFYTETFIFMQKPLSYAETFILTEYLFHAETFILCRNIYFMLKLSFYAETIISY